MKHTYILFLALFLCVLSKAQNILPSSCKVYGCTSSLNSKHFHKFNFVYNSVNNRLQDFLQTLEENQMQRMKSYIIVSNFKIKRNYFPKVRGLEIINDVVSFLKSERFHGACVCYFRTHKAFSTYNLIREKIPFG